MQIRGSRDPPFLGGKGSKFKLWPWITRSKRGRGPQKIFRAGSFGPSYLTFKSDGKRLKNKYSMNFFVFLTIRQLFYMCKSKTQMVDTVSVRFSPFFFYFIGDGWNSPGGGFAKPRPLRGRAHGLANLGQILESNKKFWPRPLWRLVGVVNICDDPWGTPSEKNYRGVAPPPL